MRIGGIIISQMSKVRKAKFSILRDVIVLVSLQGSLKFITLESERVKRWPNGVPNSSQGTKLKLASAGGQTKQPSRASWQETINCLNTALSHNNNKTPWRELAWVGWGGQTVETWLELGKNSSLIKFKPTQVKWLAKWYPTPSKLWTWLELTWVGRTVWPRL